MHNNRISVADYFNNLGALVMEQGKLSQAVEFYKISLKIKIDILG